ncbi:hypothetical protein GF377_00790, partial [candidate division GN15 bacterium]|nr:hypothetical protein [candidate division GN15 bacterium]
MITRRPGIFVRLGNLIVIQVLFVFGALALILFAPSENQDVADQQEALGTALNLLATSATDDLAAADSIAGVSESFSRLGQQLSRQEGVEFASVVSVSAEGEPVVEYAFLACDSSQSVASDLTVL